MPTYRLETQIAAPIDVVYQQMSDVNNWDEMTEGIIRIELLSENSSGPGARWKETRVMFGKEATEEMEITEAKPNRSYTVESISCGSHFRTDILFEENDGGTRVEMQMKITAQTFFAKLMTPLSWMMGGMVKKFLAKDLADAKNHIEGLTANTVAATN